MAPEAGPGRGPQGRPVRVLWLIKGLGLGGAERLLVGAAGVHDKAAFAIEAAYVVPEKEALVPDLRAAGVPVTCLGGSAIPWVVKVRSLVASGHYDVVHAHSPLLAGVARLAARTVPRRRRPRLVTTEHNGWSTFALPTRLLNALTAPLDDAALAVSEETRASIWWPRLRARTPVVVHGVDLTAIDTARADRDAIRQELDLAPDQVVVLTVANYRAQKAWPDFLAAARAVLDGPAGDRIQFLAVGQGPLEGDITALHEELRLGAGVRLLGRRDDVPRLLAAADLFTLASTYEGYPLVVMEALGAGLPVVATAVGGVVEAVDPSAGVLVPPRQPELLAAALTRLAVDGEERHRLAAGAATAGRRYDITGAVRTTEDLYRRCADHPHTDRDRWLGRSFARRSPLRVVVESQVRRADNRHEDG